MRHRPSPLFVWKLIAIVALAAGVFMFLSDPMKIVFSRRDAKISDKLAQTHFEKGETGIIFLGNSLMNAVLPVREVRLNADFEKELRRQGNLNMRVSAVKLTIGGFWNLRDLSDELLDVRPSVIVIQSEMIVSRHVQNRKPQPLTQRVGAWAGVLALKLVGQSQQQRQNRKGEKQFLASEKKTPAVRRGRTKKSAESLRITRALWSNQTVSRVHPRFVMAREFINRVSAAGIRIVIVELPVSSTSASFSTKKYFAERTAALQSLSQLGALHFAYPRVLPDDYFLDYNHANHKGRTEFLKWFLPAISQEIANREPGR